MSRFPSVLVALVSLCLAGSSHAFLDFFKKDLDKVPETAEMREMEDAAKLKVTEALEYEAAGNTDKAFDLYKGVVKKYPLTTSAAMSQYKVGSIQMGRGDYTKAFESFQKFVDDYKESSAFSAAIASQYEIAKASQTGEHKEKFIGISRKVQRSEVLKMYQDVVKNAPYSEYAPQAQYAIGEVLEQDGKGQEALAAFRKVVDSYPKTSLAADAQFRIGEISAKAIEDGSRNMANVNSSRRAFEILVDDFDGDSRIEEARSQAERFTELEAQKAFEIGRFYEKKKQYTSAELYYRRVVARSEGTSAAEAARERLAIVQEKMGEAPDQSSTDSGPSAGVGERIVSAIPRPRLGSRLFGRKGREAEEEAEQAAQLAAIDQDPPSAATTASRPPAPAATASSVDVATVGARASKASDRKGYLGPPPPNLALGKKENRMRLDTDQLQNLPFEIGKVDPKLLEKGLKTLGQDLPEEALDDLSDLVLPPVVNEDEADKPESEPETEPESASESRPSLAPVKSEEKTEAEPEDEPADDGGLKVPPPAEDENE